MRNEKMLKILQERFGDEIGDHYAGDAPAGVRDEAAPCDECGMFEVEGSCGCTHQSDDAKGGPSKAAARKILRGTKTFKDKMKKVEKWADDPAAAAMWMMKRAGRKK